ncbi:FAS1 domain-containing protein [Powellomyces hirtus]|nr:FAS1 domain-containing protein [Powellomyces hirtus]
MEDQWRNSKDEEKPSMRDVLRYHIAPDSQISGDCLHAGALIPTNLRLKSLEDRHQRIRVFRFHGEVWLNMHARIVQKDLEAENGLIHAIDRCLMPPMTIGEMLYTMPTRFSTSLAAFERTGLQEVCTKKGITVFAPTNRAWETLGFDNLRYLFSCMGQQKPSEGRSIFGGEEHPQCEGTKMLKKILKYHIATKLAYSTDLMEKETTRLGTMEGKNLEVCAVRTEGHKGRDEKKHHDVRNYNFVINKGQARIAFSDGLGSNGAVQVIDSVLIPDDVKLPHDRWMA